MIYDLWDEQRFKGTVSSGKKKGSYRAGKITEFSSAYGVITAPFSSKPAAVCKPAIKEFGFCSLRTTF
jgi:hypothetical protein